MGWRGGLEEGEMDGLGWAGCGGIWVGFCAWDGGCWVGFFYDFLFRIFLLIIRRLEGKYVGICWVIYWIKCWVVGRVLVDVYLDTVCNEMGQGQGGELE